MVRNRRLQLLAAGYAGLLLAGTLTPVDTSSALPDPAPQADVARNLVLFAPLGLLMRLAGGSFAAILAVGVLFPAAIELLQHAVPGRFPSALDVAVDAVAVVLGAGMLGQITGAAVRDADAAARRALVAGLLGAAALLLPALVLVPDAPRQGPYYTAWTPEWGEYAVFPGRVLEARIGERPIAPWGSAPDWARLRDAVQRGAPVALSAVADTEVPDRISPLVRLSDSKEEVLLIAASGGDLVVRRRTRASRLGLEEPAFRARGALARSEPGRPFELLLRTSGLGWIAVASGVEAMAFGPDPGAIGRLLLPTDLLSEPMLRILDAVAVGVCFAPVGFWLRPRWPAAIGFGVCVVALFLGPAAMGLQQASLVAWASGAVGLATGAALGRAVRA